MSLPALACWLCSLQVVFAWTAVDGFPLASGYSAKNLILPPPVNAEAGMSYKFTLTARFKGSSEVATSDVRACTCFPVCTTGINVLLWCGCAAALLQYFSSGVQCGVRHRQILDAVQL